MLIYIPYFVFLWIIFCCCKIFLL